MNYKNHYDRLIVRAIDRELDSYTESHHIVPKCLGGSNDKSNLVNLTPEEHYTAHLLLVRIYPHNKKLIHAAVMITVNGNGHDRSKNKIYGWLKRKMSKLVSLNQQGKNNSQYGTCWVNKNGLVLKIKSEEIEIYKKDGWARGRIPHFCVVCNKETYSDRSRLCEDHRKKMGYRSQERIKKSHDDLIKARKETYKSIGHQQKDKNSQYGTHWITNGIVNKKIKKDDAIPTGWCRGRIISW